MTEHQTETKVEVEVGPYDEGGTFLGQLVRFTGEEIGSHTDYAEARSSDDRGTTSTLYRTPDGSYRVHVERWTRWQGESSEAHLWPQDEDGSFYAVSEAEAREYHPQLFAAIGNPNVLDLD